MRWSFSKRERIKSNLERMVYWHEQTRLAKTKERKKVCKDRRKAYIAKLENDVLGK